MAKDPVQERYIRMTETPVPKLIASLALPTIISMLVTNIYNTADTFFVGRISTQATASVGLVFSVMSIIQALGFFCGHGSGNFVSRMLGAGNRKEAEEMAATGFTLALILGVIVSVTGLLLLDPLARLIGATETTIVDTKNYMRLILLNAPIMMSQLVLNNQLRFQGSAIYAMAGLVSGALLNIALDPLLIFVFGMGVTGAALATVISQWVSFVILFIGSRQGVNIKIRIRNIRLNGHYLLSILNGGSPSLVRQGLASVATMLLNNTAGALGGDAAIAGMSVTTRVIMLLSSALFGFGQGYQPVCSFNYGAKLYKRVKEGLFFCIKIGTVFLLGVAVLLYIFSPQVIGFFRDDPEVIKVGTVALRWQAAALPLSATVVMINMMLQSMGKGIPASITASARNGLFFIPLILLLPRFFGLFGVEITQACADVLSILVSVPLAAWQFRKMSEEEKLAEQ